jgi:hypothetical protein
MSGWPTQLDVSHVLSAPTATETYVPPALFVPVTNVIVMVVEPELVPVLVLVLLGFPMLNWLL